MYRYTGNTEITKLSYGEYMKYGDYTRYGDHRIMEIAYAQEMEDHILRLRKNINGKIMDYRDYKATETNGKITD